MPPKVTPEKAEPAAPQLPKTGGELLDRLLEKDAKLAAARKCKAGELLAHVSQAGAKAGYGEDVAKWSGPAISFAVEVVKEFEAGLRKPVAA